MEDLTNEDVADILALLDSLPYDELDLQTARFRLVLRRAPDGWTQSGVSLAEPVPAATAGSPVTAGPEATGTQASAGSLASAGALAAGSLASAGSLATTSMDHRCGYGDTDGPSLRHEDGSAGAGEVSGVSGEPGKGRASTGVGPEGGSGRTRRDPERRDGEERDREGRDETVRELVAVRAPLPGTFYRAPRPAAEPFVQVGSRVGADTVVGIVETMKLMNSVTAGVAGVVAEICVGNGEFAAHGATLVLVEAGA
jgi:biotin carboxyl carrier protein